MANGRTARADRSQFYRRSDEFDVHADFAAFRAEQALAKPLVLTGTVREGNDGVRVSYQYVTDKGRECRGRADVRTVYQFGKTLISGIKALDGC